MRESVGVEKLPLFESKPPAPWAPELYEPPYVTPPLAGASHPNSSHIAAQAAFPTAREQNKHIVACLLALGPLSADGTRGGGTAEEIAYQLNGRTFDGPWDSVIVSRRISGLRLNHVYSYDGLEQRREVTRIGRRGRPMTVHVALTYARRDHERAA